MVGWGRSLQIDLQGLFTVLLLVLQSDGWRLRDNIKTDRHKVYM